MAITHVPRFRNYESIGENGTPAGTATVVLGFQFILRLLSENGHIILIPDASLMTETLFMFGTVKSSGAAAHIDAAHYGRVPECLHVRRWSPSCRTLRRTLPSWVHARRWQIRLESLHQICQVLGWNLKSA